MRLWEEFGHSWWRGCRFEIGARGFRHCGMTWQGDVLVVFKRRNFAIYTVI